MKHYYWNPKQFNSNQKTNYITITLARKFNELHENRGHSIQNNSLSIFLKINHIKILLEKYKFYNNQEDKTGNIITFFIVRNEQESSNAFNFDKDRKVNIFVCFDHEYYMRAVSSKLLDEDELNPEDNFNDKKSDKITRKNNEFIQTIVVRFFFRSYKKIFEMPNNQINRN